MIKVKEYPRCPVCGRRFANLSGDTSGCLVHGIRAPWNPSAKELASLVLAWAQSGESHGGRNPYSRDFVKAACAVLDVE